MKTLKVGALALGMMFAGSVVAMETKDALHAQVVKLYTGIEHAGNLLTPEQQTNLDAIPDAVEFLLDQSDEEAIKGLKGFKALLEGFTDSVKYQQAGKVARAKLATINFIKTNPKKLGLLAAVAVLTVAYVAYKKYTVKKKMQVEEEDEDETVVTVE